MIFYISGENGVNVAVQAYDNEGEGRTVYRDFHFSMMLTAHKLIGNSEHRRALQRLVEERKEDDGD